MGLQQQISVEDEIIFTSQALKFESVLVKEAGTHMSLFSERHTHHDKFGLFYFFHTHFNIELFLFNINPGPSKI